MPVARRRIPSPASLLLRAPAILALVLTAWLSAGCLQEFGTCGDGACPRGTVCDPTHLRCVYADQLTTCAGAADGAACTIGVDQPGVCHRQVCLRVGCGDGMRHGPEQCDGADLGGVADCTGLGYHGAGALRCSADCTYDTSACGPRCGDGVRDPDIEACDGADLGGATCADLGFYGGTLACRDSCRLDVSGCVGRCGDGARTAGERCDGTDFGAQTCNSEGFYGGTLSCSPTCDRVDTVSCVGRCGDGVRNGPEICDGADLGGLSCASYGWYSGALRCGARCLTVDQSACAGTCGDGVVNGNELCDGLDTGGEACMSLGAAAGALGCNAYCQPERDRCFWGRWRSVLSGTTGGLNDLWGSGRGDLWAVGAAGALFHVENDDVTRVDLDVEGSLDTITGTGPDDVWIGGQHGALFHYDGDHWEPVANDGRWVIDLWAAGPDDLWAISETDEGSVARHYDGREWTVHPLGELGLASVVWGTGPRDVYVITMEATGDVLWRYDGETWTQMYRDGCWFFSVTGSAPDDVWLTGCHLLHFNGVEWTRFDTGDLGSPEFAWARARDDVWFTGGRLSHWDGERYAQVPADASQSFVGVWSSGPDDVWLITGGGGLLHSDGPGWKLVDTSPPDRPALRGILSIARDDVWAFGDSATIRHFDGKGWSDVPDVPVAGFRISIGSASAPDNVWLAGSGNVLRYDGRWQRVDAGDITTVEGIWTSGPDDVWLLTYHGRRLRHFDGKDWTVAPTLPGPPMFRALWGSARDDVWAVGVSGRIAHYDGDHWTEVPSPTRQELEAVWGSSRDNVWAVGLGGAIIHYDGTRWTSVPSNTGLSLGSLWGSGPFDVWATAGLGRILLHYDGTVWAPVDTGLGMPFVDISGSGPGDVWAVGLDGVAHFERALPTLDGGVCEAPLPLYCATSTHGATPAAGSFDRHACGTRATPAGEVHYRLASPITGRVRVTLTPRSSDLDLFALGADADGGCAPQSCARASQAPELEPEVIEMEVLQGQTMYFVVDGAEAGSYGMQVECVKR